MCDERALHSSQSWAMQLRLSQDVPVGAGSLCDGALRGFERTTPYLLIHLFVTLSWSLHQPAITR